MTYVRVAAVGALLCLAVVPAGSGAGQAGMQIVVDGSYSLDGRASQAAFQPGGPGCVPAVQQRETETVKWHLTFGPLRAGAPGAQTVRLRSSRLGGSHVWDEASAACAAFPAGHLVCRTHFRIRTATLHISLLGGRAFFHPDVSFDAASDGCTGEVHNEHPDCGARDAAAIFDFAFAGALRAQAPSVRRSALAQGGIVRFRVPRSRRCARPGVRNPNVIRQRVDALYGGSLRIASAD
jgi:hypothetical protein